MGLFDIEDKLKIIHAGRQTSLQANKRQSNKLTSRRTAGNALAPPGGPLPKPIDSPVSLC